MSELEGARREGRSWVSLAVLGALLIVALALRWRYIQEISLFVDEFVTAWAARSVLARGLPIFPSGNVYPHGFIFTYLVVPFVSGAFDETLARIPGLVVSLAGLPAAYWVGRRLFSERVGLVAAAAMAVDPAFIIWGGRARMYGLLQLFTLLAVYVYYRGLADDRPRDRYLAMGLVVAAIFTHLEAAFLLPALGLATLVAVPWRRLFRRDLILPFVVGGAGAVIFFLITNLGQPGHLETLDQEGRSYLSLSADLLSGPQAFAPVFADWHRLPLTLLAVGGVYSLFRPRFERKSPLTYLYAVTGALVVLVVVLAGPTWQRARYLFLALPLFFLIGGEVLSRLLDLVPALREHRAWQSALLALLVALYVGLTGAPAAYIQEWGYDRAFGHLREEGLVGAQDRVVTSMSTAAELYLGRNDAFAIQQGYEEYVVTAPGNDLPVDLWTATPMLTTTAAFEEMLATSPQVWFITDGWRFQTRYEPDFILSVLEQMELVYNERGVMIFRGQGYAPLPEPAVRLARRAEFGDELALTGVGLSPAAPQPGDELEIRLYWQALEGVGPAYTALLHLVAAGGVDAAGGAGVTGSAGVTGVDEPVLGGLYQADLWPEGLALPDGHRLALPEDLPPGRYRLDLGLYRPGQPEAPLLVDGSDRLPLATLVVGEAMAAPPGATQTFLDFGGMIRLQGYELDRIEGRGLHLDLWWHALGPVDRDYTVFAQLLGPDGAIAAQDDGPPGDPFFPTTTWLPGDVVADSRLLMLPEGTPAGDYELLIGLYHRPSGDRLAVTDVHGETLGDAFRLGPISLGSGSP